MSDKKKVLVTGLSGLVGTALRSDFEERYELSSLSRYGTAGLDDAHNFKGNIAELETMLPAFEGLRRRTRQLLRRIPRNIVNQHPHRLDHFRQRSN